MNLAGGFYSDWQYQVSFRVDKCVNETNNKEGEGRCASKDEIDKFVSQIKIETWSTNFKSDFKIHNAIPLRNNIVWIKADTLKPNIVT